MKENKKQITFTLSPKTVEKLEYVTQVTRQTKVSTVENSIDLYYWILQTLSFTDMTEEEKNTRINQIIRMYL